MQKQKSVSLMAAFVVLAALIAFGGVSHTTTVAAATTAPTMAATMAASAGTPFPGSGLVKGPDDKEAKKLSGAGATFPKKLYDAWFTEYKKVTGVEVSYPGGGSGAGISGIQGQTVDFGGSDAYLNDDQLKAAKGGELLHIPTALGAVVMTYNIPELKEPIKFTADTIAGIYLNKIVSWDDAALVADNPGLKAIKKDIVVVRRADASGTTNIFTSYLAAVNKEWADTVKFGTTVNWPGSPIGGQGNDGVAGVVKQTPYAVGYVELIYAIQQKLGYGIVKNKAGKFITPSLDSVTAAAAGFLANTPNDLRVRIVNGEGDTTYPISGYTWLLVYKNQPDAAKGLALTRLLWWATHDGQSFNAGLGYAPLPPSIVQKAEALILQINTNGTQALPTSIATPSAMMASTMMATMSATAAK